MKTVIRLFFLGLMLTIVGCTSTFPNQNLLGQKMIAVKGESLQNKIIHLPTDLLADDLLMLIGYKQECQFDIDRWLIGLDMTDTKVNVIEVPAIQGFFPKLMKQTINNGMRKGIPEELWKIVVTVYEDGAKLQQFTGNINPNNARVVLVNKSGEITYFYDRGFSVDALNRLRDSLKNS